MRPTAAATRSGSTLLAGPTRAREPRRVWEWPVGYGLAADICPTGTTASYAGLSTRSPYQLAVMPATYPERQRKALSLRQLPGPSLRNLSDGPGKCRRSSWLAGRSKPFRQGRHAVAWRKSYGRLSGGGNDDLGVGNGLAGLDSRSGKASLHWSTRFDWKAPPSQPFRWCAGRPESRRWFICTMDGRGRPTLRTVRNGSLEAGFLKADIRSAWLRVVVWSRVSQPSCQTFWTVRWPTEN